jgi:hypothetical protein
MLSGTLALRWSVFPALAPGIVARRSGFAFDRAHVMQRFDVPAFAKWLGKAHGQRLPRQEPNGFVMPKTVAVMTLACVPDHAPGLI